MVHDRSITFNDTFGSQVAAISGIGDGIVLEYHDRNLHRFHSSPASLQGS